MIVTVRFPWLMYSAQQRKAIEACATNHGVNFAVFDAESPCYALLRAARVLPILAERQTSVGQSPSPVEQAVEKRKKTCTGCSRKQNAGR